MRATAHMSPGRGTGDVLVTQSRGRPGEAFDVKILSLDATDSPIAFSIDFASSLG